MLKCRYHHVAVLKGGPGSEREVSLRSGHSVAEALRSADVKVTEMDVRDCTFTVPRDVEAVFPVLHGRMGEDGAVQNRLEEIGIPYVGSRSWEMPRSFDKEITHALLSVAGIPMAEWEMVEPASAVHLRAPLVLKAPREGSSIGLEIVREEGEVPAALERVRRFDRRILAESFIEGSECTVGFLGETPLPVVQIQPCSGTYDYEAKYVRNDTRYLVPAPYDVALTQKLQLLALRSYQLLGGRHLGRVDFRVDTAGNPYVLEMNPIPGFTATSLLPKAAAAVGIDFRTLCVRILDQAEVV
ncbi:MAG: D-alanine--D-alanine ligase family protein [Kiritimatiellia bacterium]